MVDSISTMGIRLSCTNLLIGGQDLLSKLSGQLATGRYSDNMTDYSSSNAQKLMNFTSEINVQKGFLNVISSISPRMEMYQLAFEGIEDTVSNAYTTVVGSSTYTATTNESLRNEIANSLDQMEYYLNMQVGDRYIFSGSRYGEAPVTDLASLPVLTTASTPTIATGDQVADYDTDYDSANPTALVPAANTSEAANIDTTKTLVYGVNSNEEAFQQTILGLRYALAATYDQTNYASLMATAKTYLNNGLTSVRALHTDSSNAYATLQKAEDTINSKVTQLKDQVDKIEGVDTNEVAIKITSYQAQLEASYSAVSKIINLSILDYLS